MVAQRCPCSIQWRKRKLTMPKITIDGKEIAFEGKPMILQIALEHGLALPHYCYHPGLSIVASCRICLAEVAQPNPRNDNKVELIPKLMPTCQTVAVDGMVVDTQSPKSAANQKAVMEYLLINHPLDCPVCDQAGECSLQDYSYQYGRSESRFEEDKIKQPKKDMGSHVYLYADRCIMCSRCVRFTREVTGTAEIGVFGRGNMEQIDVFPGHALENELSGNVVDLCPVGALLDKDFLFSQRVWFMSKTPSIDGITASGDNISIEYNEGRVYRIKPRTNLAVNKWWISDEIRYGWKFIHAEQRLRRPMRQLNGAPAPCDWSKACETAAQALKQTVADQGSGSIALLVSPMLACEEAYLLGKLATALDKQAILGLGPVPVEGQDKTFPGGYKIYAEKCPNARGVKRALQRVADDVLDYDAFLKEAASGASAVIVTGNYPAAWAAKNLIDVLKKKFVLLIDTLPNDLTDKADVVLPGATWAEKAGTFENASHRLQTFQPAIPVLEGSKPEGQIALDLLAACGAAPKTIYDAARVRLEMADEFVTDVHQPQARQPKATDMELVEL